MDFNRYMAIDEQLTRQAYAIIDEVKSLQDLEDMGLGFRSTIRKITIRALGKMYKALKDANPGLSPSEIVMTLISYLQQNGDGGTWSDVAKVVVREMDPGIKKEFIEDLKKKYPNMDYSKLGIN